MCSWLFSPNRRAAQIANIRGDKRQHTGAEEADNTGNKCHLAEVRSALTGILLPPDSSHTPVTFDALEGGRAAPVDHLLVLGLSEGEFPQPPAPDPLYAPHEREGGRLPLRVRETGEEASLWWQILGNCRRTFTLLRPRLDESGAAWPASPYYDAVLAVFDGAPVEVIPIAPQPAVENAACASELLVALAAGNPAHLPADLHLLWQQAHSGLTISRLRQSWQEAGIYEGCLDAADLRADLGERFGPHHRWSASRLSRYASCPAGFFAQQVLALEALAEPVEGMDVMVRGSLLHAALERLGAALARDAVSVCAANHAQILLRLDEVCNDLFPQAPRHYGFVPDLLWEEEQAELRRLLSSLVTWECEENGDAPRFHPFKQELHFGLYGHPPLRLILPNGESLLVGGVVDRIDRDAEGNLRLIDYKGGSTPYSRHHLLDGTAIQSAIYALAVEEILGEEGRVVESSYWHVAGRKRSGELRFNGAVRDHADVQGMLAQLARLVGGIRQGRFPSAPARPQDGGSSCRRDCELAPFCRVSRLTIAKARRAAEG